MADGQQGVGNKPPIVARGGELYVVTPYGASKITKEQAVQIYQDYYSKGALPSTGGGAGTRKANTAYEREMARIKSRRALSQMGGAQTARGIRRTGKGTIKQMRGFAAESGGGRGPAFAGPAEFVSRQMGRGLGQAAIAQAREQDKFTGEQFAAEQKRQEALYNIALGRARALDAETRRIVDQMRNDLFPEEFINKFVEGRS